MTKQQRKKCQKILEHYGVHHQMDKLMEELRELLEACENVKRASGDLFSMVDEIADVEVMLWQIKYALHLFDEVDSRKEYKIDRQIGRMEDGKEEKGSPGVFGADRKGHG